MASHTCRFRKLTNRIGVLAALPGLLAIATASAQVAEPRKIAAHGDTEPNVPRAPNESVIVAGPDRVLCHFNQGHPELGPDARIGFGVAYSTPEPNDPDKWSWTEEWVTRTNPPYTRHVDPSLVHVPDLNDPNATGRFVAAALAQTGHGVIWSCYPAPDPNARSGIGFAPWQTVRQDPYAGDFIDKPWLLLGEHSPTVEEYYVVWWEHTNYGYARTIDGGQDWGGGAIYLDDDPNLLVGGTFCAQPTVHGDSPLYVAYKHNVITIRFLKGIDTTDPNGLPTVSFRRIRAMGPRMLGGMPPLLTDQVRLNAGEVNDYVPGDFIKLLTTPQFAIDPIDQHYMYVVYHDTVEPVPDPAPPDVDVDVFLQRLSVTIDPNDPNVAIGHLGRRIRVNQDDNPQRVSDQFTPTLTVDGLGRIHVIFYDDRDYDQVDDDDDAKFDVYYAMLAEYDAQNPNWTEVLLPANTGDPNDPDPWAFDSTRFLDGPREYQGICHDGYRDWIWTAYTGTNILEPDGHNFDTVIYTNRVGDLGPPP